MLIADLARALAERKISSRELVERALAASADPQGEGARVYLHIYEQEALAAADRIDARHHSGAKLPALAGIPISIKDNCDEAGQVTLAGSVLTGTAPARRDATVVSRLRNAGAVIVGRTNMTEFAYSGLGINPHYGTPRCAFDRAMERLPGGSSSGAAISVSDGMAAAAIGTDTGGSVRIPAALNGLVGFKPTAQRIPLDGVLPLSPSLDSVGPIAKSVADCALLDRILADDNVATPLLDSVRGLRFAIPTTVFQTDVSAAVARAFSSAMTRLSKAGARLVELPMTGLMQASSVNPRGILLSAEAFRVHREWLQSSADKYDPRVIARIRPGQDVTAAQYEELLRLRESFIGDITNAAAGYDAMLMPTTPDTAPTIAEVARDDESYFRFNGRMTRNTVLVNLFDGCALSIPCHEPGSAPVGLMIAGTRGTDRKLLSIGHAVETALSNSSAL